MTAGATARNLGQAAWLKAGALARLLGVLDGDGEEARVVGGAVRNALLDMPIAEIDVATTAVPDEVVKRVTAAGFKPVPTGIEHGTITVVIEKHPFEVTTLRRDVETYGRHAKVAFGRDWKVDAERRDFTINGLSATRDGTVYDYVGGLDDLAARRVRFIGDPAKRIAEDYLRILRFFRFHAAYGAGGHPDADGLAACIAGRAGLDQLSRERVRMEMMKLLVAPHAVPTLIAMADSGLLLRVLGGVGYLAAFENMAKVEAAAGARHRAGGRRAGGARAALPAQGRALYRPRAAGLGALARLRARPRLARARDLAGALDRAGVALEGGGLHRARGREGPGARRSAQGGRGGMDRGRVFGGGAGARSDC